MRAVTANAKYLFDLDFGPSSAPKPSSPAEILAQIEEAERKGFRDGFAAAEKEGIAATERRTAVAFEQIGGAIQQLAGSLAATQLKLETEAVELALTIARKLSTELILREPFAEIAALATECLRQLTAAPHVVVRVNDALHETARERLEEIAQSRGFEGRLVVVAEPEIAVGDCRIEWADGGVVRDQAKTDIAIGDVIGRYLGARQTAAMPELGDINP